MYSPEIGDCIGVESGADLQPDVPAPPRPYSHRRRRPDAAAPPKEFPPPISWLARTENQSSHMPWVMRRYYSDDGRLIIKEEKVEHHEYFLADRSNGRLVLNLVNLDEAWEECIHAKEIENNGSDCGDEIDTHDAGEIDGEPVREESYKYIGMTVNPCGGYVAAAAVAPPVMSPRVVHT